jgi:hypothetical protein
MALNPVYGVGMKTPSMVRMSPGITCSTAATSGAVTTVAPSTATLTVHAVAPGA